jgi:hypothetical protein
MPQALPAGAGSVIRGVKRLTMSVARLPSHLVQSGFGLTSREPQRIGGWNLTMSDDVG